MDDGDSITLSIKDNGRGFDPGEAEPRVGHSLNNMRERASVLGGELTIESLASQGTAVRVRVPKLGTPDNG